MTAEGQGLGGSSNQLHPHDNAGSNPNTSQPAQLARLLGPATLIASGDFFYPTGLALDNAGNIYISEGIDENILKVPYSGGSYGTPVKVGSGLPYPSAVTVDSAGNVYFATYDKVEKIPYSGGGYGLPVVLASGFNQLTSVKLDSAGNLYVADYSANAVIKIPYSAGGYGGAIAIGSGFKQPTGLAVDGAGNVYVADYGNSLLKEIPYNGGNYGTPLVLAGAGNGGFDAIQDPGDVSIDSAGNIYVSDSGLIKEITNSNFYNPVIAGGNSDYGVVVDVAGNVYSLNSQSTQGGQVDSVVKIGPVQQVFDFGASNVGFTSPITQTLSFSIDVGGTVTPFVVTQGSPSLDFVDTGTGTCATNGTSYNYSSKGDVCTVVVSFTPDTPGVRNGAVIMYGQSQLAVGTLQGTGNGAQITFPPGLAPVDSTGGSSSPGPNYGLVMNNDENGYVDSYLATYYGNKGAIYTTSRGGSGGTGQQYTCGTCHPVGLAVDQTGRIIFSDISDNTVKLFAGYDAQYEFSPLTVATGFYQPMAVAVDAVGSIYVADTNNSVIKKIPYYPSGSSTNYYNQYNYGTPVVLGSGFSYPEGVAVDGAGNVYVSDTYNNAVKKIPYSGGVYGTPVTLATGFNYPAGIVLDGGSNIYVADNGNNAVKKIPYSGGVYGTPIMLNNTGLSGPAYLYVDTTGNVWVSEPVQGRILEIDLSDVPALTFPSTAAGSTSASATVTLANTGNYPLTLVPPPSGYNPSVSANFSLGNSSTCPQVSSMSSMATTLAAGASCTEVVSFVPTMAGTITGSLTVSDKLAIPSATVTQTVALNGTATPAPPGITVSSIAILYGTATTTLSASITFSGPTPSVAPSVKVDSGTPVYMMCMGGSSPASCSVGYSTGSLSVGPHTITVSYPGDANYAAASGTGTLTVNAPTVNVTVPAVSTKYGTATTILSASIAYNGSTPTGGVNVKVDSGAAVPMMCLGSSSPASCSASYATGTLTAGSHTITVAFAGDATYAAASNTGALTVTGATATVTVPAVSTTYGAATTTLSASISYAGGAAPTGSVSFKVDSGASVAATCSGAASPLSCLASYPTGTLSVGSHTITAAIAADNNYLAASNSGALTITAATPSVSVSTVSTTYGTATTALSASIAYAGPAAPTGVVTFKVDSGASVVAACSGTASPLSCSAGYSTGTLSLGIHTITVTLAADANYTAASNTGTLTVNAPPDFTFTNTTTQYQSVLPGQSAAFSFQLTPQNGLYPGPVTFSVSGLPPGATYTIAPASVAQNAGPQTVTLVVQTMSPVAQQNSVPPWKKMPAIGFAVLLLPLCLRRGTQRLRRSGVACVLLLSAGLAALGVISGCGSNNGFLTQPSVNYTINFTVSSGSAVHTSSVVLNVQ